MLLENLLIVLTLSPANNGLVISSPTLDIINSPTFSPFFIGASIGESKIALTWNLSKFFCLP